MSRIEREERHMHVRAVELPTAPEPDPIDDPLVAALVAEVAERGPAAGDPEEVAGRAGLTRAEFDRRYRSFDECLVDSLGRIIASYNRSVGGAFNEHPDDWRTALRAAAYAAADWMRTNPELMAFGAVGVLQTGNEMAMVRREELIEFGVAMIERGRAAAPDSARVPEDAPEMATGSVVNLVRQRLQEGAGVDPVEMVPEMMYLVVRIYLGEEAAREELAMPRPGGAEEPAA